MTYERSVVCVFTSLSAWCVFASMMNHIAAKIVSLNAIISKLI
uniref:Uncharacterized protein n=1 Tax=Rhizophora mucronata TaxID=61149 RepID=A0A2P2LIG5_RHIMU